MLAEYGGVDGGLRRVDVSRWCEGRVKVARSTRSGRDTAEQLRQDVHLYTCALVGRDYFQPGTPLGERCWRLRWHDSRGSKA